VKGGYARKATESVWVPEHTSRKEKDVKRRRKKMLMKKR
jgi:hypothetical protein